MQNKRKDIIMGMISENQSLSVNEISTQLGVSSMTVRRYLKLLEREKKIYRTFGGAVDLKLEGESPYHIRQSEHKNLKKRISKAAAAQVKDGQTIILDSGTSCFELAKNLVFKKNLTILTQDLAIATLLYPYHTVLMQGGKVSPDYGSIDPILTNSLLQMLRADIYYLGASAISTDGTISTPILERALLKQLYISQSAHSYALIDSSKFGKNSIAAICAAKDIDGVFTNTEMDPELYNRLQSEGAQIFRV